MGVVVFITSRIRSNVYPFGRFWVVMVDLRLGVCFCLFFSCWVSDRRERAEVVRTIFVTISANTCCFSVKIFDMQPDAVPIANGQLSV